MPKLFASDFDGTIHTFGESDSYVVSPTNTQAILDLQSAGELFGVCTGRPLYGLTDQTDAAPGLDFSFDFYIATTGAALFDRDRQLIWNQTAPKDVVRECCELLRPLNKSDEFLLIVASEAYWSLEQGTPWPMLRYADSFDEIGGPFYGLGIETATVEQAAEAAALVNERFSGVLTAYVNLASIDVVPAGCSKGTGLRRAAEYFGATLTAGMGDSFNDLPLLDAADVAYTFHSADPGMHSHADVLVDSAAEAIRDFMAR